MSRDRKLLYNLVLAATEGEVSPKLAKARIGPINQARWLTLASRIVRLYMSVPNHLGAYVMTVLEQLVNFIINVYFKVRYYLISFCFIFITLLCVSVRYYVYVI